MIQAKFSLEEEHVKFLNQHSNYGFKDKSAVIRKALTRFQRELEKEMMKMSADLYAEIYEEEDEGSRDLTESAISEWPE